MGFELHCIGQFVSNLFLGGVMKVFEYKPVGPLLFYLVSMIVDICVLEVFDERSIGFWG